MFSYAFAKILRSQFELPLIATIDESINNFNGFMLTWYYYGYSRTYGLVIAYTQIASAILLLFRKTERVGVVLFLSVIINILFINYFYEIDDAKSMSMRLTIMGVFLLLSDWKAFKNYFFKTNSEKQLIPDIIPAKAKNIYSLKFLIIPFMILYKYNDIADFRKGYLVKNELFGVWELTPRNSKTKIDRLYIDYDNRIKVRDTLDNLYYGQLELDDQNKILKFKVQDNSWRAYYYVQDSIEKMDVPEESLQEVRRDIRKFYNKRNNIMPMDLSFKYQLKGDSLIIFDERKIVYVNKINEYRTKNPYKY